VTRDRRYVMRPSLFKILEKPWTGIQKRGITGQKIIVMRARKSGMFILQ
jgi:hypothetical protein